MCPTSGQSPGPCQKERIVGRRRGRESLVVGGDKAGALLVALDAGRLGVPDRIRRDVDPDHVAATLGESEREPAGAAAELDDPARRGRHQPEKGGHRGEVLGGGVVGERLGQRLRDALGADAGEILAFALLGIGLHSGG